MNFKVSLSDQIKQNIQAAATEVSRAHLTAAQSFMRDLSQMTYSKAQEMASQKLHSTRQQYVDNLSFDQVDQNNWVITLNKDVAHIEEGYSSFDMIKAGLASGKNAKRSKEGFNYIHIPLEHKQGPASSQSPLHSNPVQSGQAFETTKGDLAKDLKRLKGVFGVGQMGTFNYPSGAPVLGQVWKMSKDAFTPTWTMKNVFGDQISTQITGGKAIHKNLVGLTGIQYQDGKGVKTAYLTWRTVSEKTLNQWTQTKAGKKGQMRQGTWIHPGYSGAKIFPELEQWAIDQLNRELKRIFSEV